MKIICVNKTKQVITILLMVFYIITSIFPPFFYFFPIQPSLLMGAFWLGMVVLYPGILKTKSMLILYVYITILTIYHFFGNSYFSDISSVIMPFLLFSCPIFLSEVTYKYISKNYYKYIVFATSIVLSAIIIISIPSWLIDPLIMRGASINATGDDVFDISLYYWVIDYGIIHQIFILLPVVLFLLRSSLKIKIAERAWWLIFLLLLLFIIYASNAGAVFILSIILLFISLWFRGRTVNSNIILSLLIVLVFFLIIYFLDIIPIILQFIKSLMPEGSYSADKLEEIRVFLLTGDKETDLSNRSDFYSMSFNLFLESPLFGTSTPNAIGNHAYVIDQLALLGLFGCIPLFMLYKVQLQRLYKTLNYTKLIFILAAFSYIFLLTFKYSFGNIFIFGLLPIFCWYGEFVASKKKRI